MCNKTAFLCCLQFNSDKQLVSITHFVEPSLKKVRTKQNLLLQNNTLKLMS